MFPKILDQRCESMRRAGVLIPDREIENHDKTLTSNSMYRCFSVFPFPLFIVSWQWADSIKVKTCKRWQAAHLHRRETFETFYILLHWGELFQGILQFKIWTMISLLHSGPKIRLGTVYVQQGKIVWVEQNLLNVQQTIYSVRAYSCWICSPFMRYVYSKI